MFDFCPFCGGKTVGGARYCPHCGKDLTAAENASISPKTTHTANEPTEGYHIETRADWKGFNFVVKDEPTTKAVGQTETDASPVKPAPRTYTLAEQKAIMDRYFKYNVREDGKFEVWGVKGEPTELVIPPVASLCTLAREPLASVEKITFLSGVKEIESWSFFSMEHLAEIEFPEGLEKIGQHAFYGCTSLRTLNIPQSVSYIEHGAFAKAYSLESITVEDGNRDYVSNAGCLIRAAAYDKKLVAVTRSADLSKNLDLTEIGASAFSESHIASIILPDNVRRIDNNAFADCRELVSITLPASLSVIEYNAFSNCTNLKEIRFRGSKSQWRNVVKGSRWDKHTGRYKVIFES